MKRIVITIENDAFDYSKLFTYLEKNGFFVERKPFMNGNKKNVIERLKGFDAVLAGGDPFCEEVLKEISDTVKIIARFGSGFDKIDLESATKLGIAVTNTPIEMSGAVAELTLALMLCISRGIINFNKMTKKGNWWQNYVGSQLEKKTVGLIGFGVIAQKLVKYLNGFSTNIIAYDLKFDKSAIKRLSVKYCTIDEIFEKSDYVSIHTPLTSETIHMIDYRLLSKMKPSAYLINTSRGKVVSEKDLIKALQEGKLAGAALDVLEEEPINVKNKLLKMDNIIITPHIGATTKETIDIAGKCAANNIIAFFKNKKPQNILNPLYIKYRN